MNGALTKLTVSSISIILNYEYFDVTYMISRTALLVIVMMKAKISM